MVLIISPKAHTHKHIHMHTLLSPQKYIHESKQNVDIINCTRRKKRKDTKSIL